MLIEAVYNETINSSIYQLKPMQNSKTIWELSGKHKELKEGGGGGTWKDHFTDPNIRRKVI